MRLTGGFFVSVFLLREYSKIYPLGREIQERRRRRLHVPEQFLFFAHPWPTSHTSTCIPGLEIRDVMIKA